MTGLVDRKKRTIKSVRVSPGQSHRTFKPALWRGWTGPHKLPGNRTSNRSCQWGLQLALWEIHGWHGLVGPSIIRMLSGSFLHQVSVSILKRTLDKISALTFWASSYSFSLFWLFTKGRGKRVFRMIGRNGATLGVKVGHLLRRLDDNKLVVFRKILIWCD